MQFKKNLPQGASVSHEISKGQPLCFLFLKCALFLSYCSFICCDLGKGLPDHHVMSFHVCEESKG